MDTANANASSGAASRLIHCEAENGGRVLNVETKRHWQGFSREDNCDVSMWEQFAADCLHAGLALIKLVRTWRIASDFGSLCGVAIILPIQVGLPLDAQRGAIPQETLRRRFLRFACPEAAIKKG